MTINDRIERLEEYLSVLWNHIQYGHEDYAALVISDMRRELKELRQVIEGDVRSTADPEALQADGSTRGTGQR